MKIRYNKITIYAGYCSAVVVLLLLMGNGGMGIEPEKASLAIVTFGVHCYDVGAGVLEGMPGVIRVEKGFRHLREIDTVQYDPSKIAVDRMEEALKLAGTYRETIL